MIIADLEWRDIPGHPMHQISEYGHILSYANKIPILIQNIRRTKQGVLNVLIYDENKKQVYLPLNELIAKVFIPNPKNLPYANAIDGDLFNTHYTNLKWSEEKDIPKDDGIEWRYIPMYPKYKISNTGEIKSYMDRIPVIMKKAIDFNSYYNIHIFNVDGVKKFSVHRLVAITFIPNYDNKPFVDHINRNKQDNRVENLRWATESENRLNVEPDLIHPLSKEIAKYDLNGNFIESYINTRIAGEDNNLNSKTIQKCGREELDEYGGFKWVYITEDEDPYIKQEGEIFKQVIGDFGEYNLNYPKHFISNFGNLITNKGYKKKTSISNGYYDYKLKKMGMRAHRLVALFFVEGRTEERNIVNHRDENKLNCHYTNLEWVTQKENAQYSVNRKKYTKLVIGELKKMIPKEY